MTSALKNSPRVRRYIQSREGGYYYPWNLVRPGSKLPSPMLAAAMTQLNRECVDSNDGLPVLYLFRPAGDTSWPPRLKRWSVYEDEP